MSLQLVLGYSYLIMLQSSRTPRHVERQIQISQDVLCPGGSTEPSFACATIVQYFHWNRQAGNYAFLESQYQCLHDRLGSIASSQPVRESR